MPWRPKKRDPHAFAPGDLPILMPRRLAVGVLEGLEMWRETAEGRTGKKDKNLRELIAELTDLLTEDDSWTPND